MLMAQHLIGFGAGGSLPSLEFLQTSAEIAGSSPITFSSQNIGSAASDRFIIAVFNGLAGIFTSGSEAVTIGGVSAAVSVVAHSDTVPDCMVVIASALVPTGSDADIVISFSPGADTGFVVSLYRATGLLSLTPTDTASNLTDVVSMSIDVQQNGFIVASSTFESTSAISSVGISEDFESAVFSGRKVGGSASLLAEELARTISFDGGAGAAAGAAVSFR